MQTLTELTQKENEKRERALRYEQALKARDNAKAQIETLEKRPADSKKQLKLVDEIEALATKLDATIAAQGGYLAREVVLNALAAVHKTHQRRLDQINEQLKRWKTDLATWEAALKEYQ